MSLLYSPVGHYQVAYGILFPSPHQSLTSAYVPRCSQVQNLSYWYQARHVIGPRRHMHHGIKWDKKKEAWEAYIYTNRYR